MSAINRKNGMLPEWLDAERVEAIFYRLSQHPSKRVEDVLELLSRLRAGLSGSEKMRIMPRLNAILKPYRWGVLVIHTAHGFQVVRLLANKAKLSADEQWEHQAIVTLLDFVPYLGNPPRIRRCADTACGEWLFVSKGKRKFCNDNCKQHHYDSDPKRRVTKAEKMRKHRIVVKGYEVAQDNRSKTSKKR